MDTLQHLLTIVATVIECFFFGYLTFGFLVYSFQQQATVNHQRVSGRVNHRSASERLATTSDISLAPSAAQPALQVPQPSLTTAS